MTQEPTTNVSVFDCDHQPQGSQPKHTPTAKQMATKPQDCEYMGGYFCINCGYISVEQLDLETKFLDLHCKCGAAVVRVFNE